MTQKIFNLDKEWKKYGKMFDDRQESSQALNPNTFHQTIDFSSMCQHNFIQNMIHILVNIIITNPTHSNLLLWTPSMPRFVKSNTNK
jgi:hypothetical protein